MTEAQTEICQNCRNQFTIEPEDFQFYEKIKVPPPTFCPECRAVRRLTWRNERSLYHGTCSATGKKVITPAQPVQRTISSSLRNLRSINGSTPRFRACVRIAVIRAGSRRVDQTAYGTGPACAMASDTETPAPTGTARMLVRMPSRLRTPPTVRRSYTARVVTIAKSPNNILTFLRM